MDFQSLAKLWWHPNLVLHDWKAVLFQGWEVPIREIFPTHGIEFTAVDLECSVTLASFWDPLPVF